MPGPCVCLWAGMTWPNVRLTSTLSDRTAIRAGWVGGVSDLWPPRKVRSKTSQNTNDTDRSTSARLLPNQIILRHVLLYVSYQIEMVVSPDPSHQKATPIIHPLSPSCSPVHAPALSLSLTLLTNRSALAAAPRAHRHRIPPAEL